MKNRFLKGAHVSEGKINELLKLFSDDLNATQIAEISGISRITVNAYLKMIRTLLAEHCEEMNRQLSIIAQNGYSSSNGNGHIPSAIAVKPLYGLRLVNEDIYACEIRHIDHQTVHNWLRKKLNDPELDNCLSRFQAIADFNTLTLYRTSANGHSFHGDELDQFWGLLRSRMVKFRGLNSGTIFLHVKETEFRYNNRDKELYDVLMKMLTRKPLHYARRN